MSRSSSAKTGFFRTLFFPFRVRPGTSAPERVERVLVIRQDNRIGNLILITPLLSLIKQRWPACRLDVVVGGFFGSVLADNPDIHTLKVFDQLEIIRKPWRLFPFLRALRKVRYDIVFDLKPAFSFNNMALTVVSGAGYRVGCANALSRDFFHCAIAPREPEVYEAHYLASLMKPFLAYTAVPEIRYAPIAKNVMEAKEALEKAGRGGPSLVGIHTGGRGEKGLALERLIALGICLRDQGVETVFFFGPDEKDERSLFEAQRFICFAPATIAEFGGFLPHLRLFVSCDTGPMHMAAAAGVATLSFFMAINPTRFGPRGPRNLSVIVYEDTDVAALVLSRLQELA